MSYNKYSFILTLFLFIREFVIFLYKGFFYNCFCFVLFCFCFFEGVLFFLCVTCFFLLFFLSLVLLFFWIFYLFNILLLLVVVVCVVLGFFVVVVVGLFIGGTFVMLFLWGGIPSGFFSILNIIFCFITVAYAR